MKRFFALALMLSVASCDSSMKAADGTSSETQSSLQALADNVQKTPEGPGMASGSSVAARGLSDSSASCGAEQQWTRYGWLQAESYDGSIWWELDTTSEWAWKSVRNELALDAGGNPIEGCHKGYISARAQQSQMSRTGVMSSFNGLYWRDRDTGGMTDALWEGAIRYPSGFALAVASRRKGPGMPMETDTLRETTYSFADGRYAFTFSSSDPVYGENVHQQEWMEAYAESRPMLWCVPIFDMHQGGAEAGSVCEELRDHSWVIRDRNGGVVSPAGSGVAPLDDSMGIRILSTRWDGDSLRIALRVQTAPFALRQWSRTTVLVGDSVGRSAWSTTGLAALDSVSFPDTNFVGPRGADVALHRSALGGKAVLQVDLQRRYRSIDGASSTIGTWFLSVPERP